MYHKWQIFQCKSLQDTSGRRSPVRVALFHQYSLLLMGKVVLNMQCCLQERSIKDIHGTSRTSRNPFLLVHKTWQLRPKVNFQHQSPCGLHCIVGWKYALKSRTESWIHTLELIEMHYQLSFAFFDNEPVTFCLFSAIKYSTISGKIFYLCIDTSTSKRNMHFKVRIINGFVC